MTPVAPEAAVRAIQEALGCKPRSALCARHDEWMTDRGCPVAVKAADAALIPIAAWALRDWIDEWPTTPDDGTFLATVARDGRARADRMEREP